MHSIIRYKNLAVTIFSILLCVFIFTTCLNSNGKKESPATQINNYEKFAGSEKCMACHKEIYTTHLLTEHHLSSAPVNAKNIIGSFEEGKNKFVFSNGTYVRMEKNDSGYYQVEWYNGEEGKKGKFDIVIGSGRKGQSYLSWVGNGLVQLPVTYFTPAQTWSNSPGFPADRARYNRPITSRCLECHSTYFEKTSDTAAEKELFDRNRIVFGVDCEKCHGPAADHVAYQTQNPTIKQAKFIINPGRLTRQQNLDLCGLCHGGRINKTKPSFQFQAGDKLSDFFALNANPVDATSIDVHGNQLGLLTASKCFINSQMTCSSCHNTHQNQKDKIELFSQKCQACHSNGHEKLCKLASTTGASIIQNCIDCHMPKQRSASIAVNLQGADTLTPVLMRTHYIKAYPDETQKVLAYFKKAKK